MEALISIIFFIMFLIIIGVIVYLVYDYMDYKDDVDKSFEKSTNFINDNMIKLYDNIDITDKNLTEKIHNTDKDVRSIDVKTDNLNNKLNNSLDRINGNFSKAYDNDIHLYKTMNASYSNLLRNDTYLNNAIGNKYNDLNGSMNDMNKSVNSINNSLDNFDTALKKYFTFAEGNQGILNDKIFKHVFSGVTPNLQLISHVDAVSGITIKTPANLIDNKNVKICNDRNGCMNLNVNNDGFNITPENINKLTINSKKNKPLALFDMQNDGIYFGGSDINAPMFIQNSNLYLNNVNFIVKPPGQINTKDNFKIARISGSDIYAITNNAQKMIDYFNANKPLFMNAMKHIAKTYATDIKETIRASINLIVQYSILNQPLTDDKGVSTGFTNNLVFKINVTRQLKEGDSIIFKIPRSEIGNFLSDAYKFDYIGENDYINFDQSSMQSKGDYIVFEVKIKTLVSADSAILFKITGNNILSNVRQIDNTVGVAIGQIFIVPTPQDISVSNALQKLSEYK